MVQECTRIFNEALEGKHMIRREPLQDMCRIGDTKVSFYHMHGSRYYGIYYGKQNSVKRMNIEDPDLEALAMRVYHAAQQSLVKQQQKKDCKLMEELLRS